MAKWEVEVIFEPTGTYMNFEYETSFVSNFFED